MSINNNVQGELIPTLRAKALNNVLAGKKFSHTMKLDYTAINPLFLGTVTVHRPSEMEKMRIGIIRAGLLGGLPPESVDTPTYNYAHLFATLEVVVDSKPDWLDVDDPEVDAEILWAIYEAYTKWLDSFRTGSTASQPQGDSADTGVAVPVLGNGQVEGTTDRE